MEHYTGMCSYCKEMVTPTIVFEENTIRRDVFVCPNCGNKILKCMTPGCHNYACGHEYYDENLCVECTANIPTAAAGAVGFIASVLTIFSGKGGNK